MLHMAQECTDQSSSSAPPNWWDASSLSSWANIGSTWHQRNPTSNSSCEEDVSINSTSFTNHSGLTVDSSRASSNEFIGEHASDNHLWTHVLLHGGSNGDLHNSGEIGENFVDPVSSKSISSGIIYEPVCDYLKKMDSNWEFTNSPASSFNNLEKQLNGYNESLIESERLTKLSNLVSNWSIAPPDPDVYNSQFDAQATCNSNNISLSPSMNLYYSQPFGTGTIRSTTCSGLISCHGDHDFKVQTDQHQEIEAPTSVFSRSFSSNTSSMMEGYGKYYNGMMPRSGIIADTLTFSSRLTKPLIDVHASKPCFKPLNLSDCKKQGRPTNSPTRISGRIQGITNEGKKKRCEETNSDTVLKKAKHNESCTVSSTKMQAPKVKLGDRITALQQIVSPFGKTDTASVLLEAIGYIKFLQEQVQLLSNPYMKSNSHKDPWGGLDRKDNKGYVKVDLRSRGLCLVPISCTPQAYRENTGADYWSPTYRGCLYR